MKERKKRSRIWKIGTEQLKQIVRTSNTLSDILRYFNVSIRGGNSKTLQRRLHRDKINFSHIKLGRNSNRGKKFDKILITTAELLTYNPYCGACTVRKRILKEKLLPYKCVECGLGDRWQTKILALHLDHINGVSVDHRLENLRFLCPNCHSQTETFGSRNKLRS